MTVGATQYASNTAGELSETPGTYEVTVGIAKSATQLYFMPRYNQQLTEDQQDALAGTSGSPSSSNKYVTADDVTEAKTASKIARRDSNSDILVATTPTDGDAAASKTYVDNNKGSALIDTDRTGVSATDVGSGTETTLITKSIAAKWKKQPSDFPLDKRLIGTYPSIKVRVIFLI